ncbi:hypothetical protein TVAG_043890 [Trichomonas vaginalis G3]|uniref:Uncharacterized protein n=1 Tax=Trichomonas vaginalis (strain ATCC PRA-98 / G3) TaxID=412133 RepID=A2E0E9_TRIV3|nr:hypothetical protein TVAGG3_0540940 [Trichomonas vaginalis G3]EAY13829.1 hypothetical protein TVAG_043890 [Trichomonas vaginalis G3]KAI5519834.1 hypothetical protein TVAGG3_0540940 [Trichomonas vaginalis G3]|eukprot:XP_001326052.1 hypothetical protein [Trichomonas vaginalis G3]
MTGKAKQSPRITPNRNAEKSATTSSKKVTPTGKSALKLKNLCSVTPPTRNANTKEEEKVAEPLSQIESRIRCELRLEMLIRMREMQDYYESKIADLTEAMDADSYTISALYENGQSESDSSKNKVNPEILEVTKEIEESVAKREEYFKLLDEKKRHIAVINQEIQATEAENFKLREERNRLQMRVDALRKQKQDEDLRINASNEEQKRKEFLAKECKNEDNDQATKSDKESSTSLAQKKTSKKSVEKQSSMKEDSRKANQNKVLSRETSKADKVKKPDNVGKSENSKSEQNSIDSSKKVSKDVSARKINENASRSRTKLDTVGEFNQKPYQIKITPQLVHKAKKNKD